MGSTYFNALDHGRGHMRYLVQDAPLTSGAAAIGV